MSESTQSEKYAQYLIDHQKKLLTRIFQVPYYLHLKFMRLGRTLDYGCGAGRNLGRLQAGSLGVDHNAKMIDACKLNRLTAMTADQWNDQQQHFAGYFDSILLSHVAEHMSLASFSSLLAGLLPTLRKGGRVVIICPQEAGYRRDSTHIEFIDFNNADSILGQNSIIVENQYSFPFPRSFGGWFPYNEFITIGRKA